MTPKLVSEAPMFGGKGDRNGGGFRDRMDRDRDGEDVPKEMD